VVQQLVRRIPDGHQVKREVDFILNQISDTMTPMHYHIREVIFVTYNKVSSPVLITGDAADATHLSAYSVMTSRYAARHCRQTLTGRLARPLMILSLSCQSDASVISNHILSFGQQLQDNNVSYNWCNG